MHISSYHTHMKKKKFCKKAPLFHCYPSRFLSNPARYFFCMVFTQKGREGRMHVLCGVEFQSLMKYSHFPSAFFVRQIMIPSVQ